MRSMGGGGIAGVGAEGTHDAADHDAGGAASLTAIYARLGAANVFATGEQRVQAGAAGTIPLVARGAASQTASLQEWQNSSGTVLTKIGSGGALVSVNDVLARDGTSPRMRVGMVNAPGNPAGLTFGSSDDTNLYRSAADTLKTDDAFHVGGAFLHTGASFGVFNTGPTAKQTVTGSRSLNPALASLLTALHGYGIITDNSIA